MTRTLKLVGVSAGLVLVAGLLVALMHIGEDRAYQHRVDSIMGVEKQKYLDTTGRLRVQLSAALFSDSGRGDTIKKARAATAPLKKKVEQTDAAVVVADASGDSAEMIRGRDATIASRDAVIASHENTIGLQAERILGLVGDGDSTSRATRESVVGLFRAGRVADSSRIVQLEETLLARPKGGLRISLGGGWKWAAGAGLLGLVAGAALIP